MSKKLFSSKQKKVQLQEKRVRKQSRDGFGSESGDESEDRRAGPAISVAKLNQQPKRIGRRDQQKTQQEYDSNRYRLHFYRESKDVLQRKKEESSLPIKNADESSMEMSLQEIYQPGTELDFPKRPSWSFAMSKEELDAKEQRYFKNYVENIFKAHADSEDLSYFELNLETWRQLWRVIEMSDIFLVIVDLRFPVLHFPPTLYKYITEETNKSMMLVLNKIDFVPAPLAIAWKKYFEITYPSLKVILFGSAPRAAVDVRETFKKKKPVKQKNYQICFGAEQIFDVCKSLTEGKVNLAEWKERLGRGDVSGVKIDPTTSKAAEGSLPANPTSLKNAEKFKDGMLTIGCIGEPNVGKSSVINALFGRKVVSVSKTPGHTKHFQTIFLAPNVRLCDCPGLVFPATAPKVLQILGGIYPISQVSDPVSVVGYLAARVPLIELLKIKHPRLEESGQSKTETLQWSAMDICEAWAIKRSFYTAKAARPDVYRAANHLLRVTLEGKICLRMYPPGYTDSKAEYARLPETLALQKQLLGLEALLGGGDGEATAPNEGEIFDDSDDDDSVDGEGQQAPAGERGRSSSEESAKDEDEDAGRLVMGSNPFALLDESN